MQKLMASSLAIAALTVGAAGVAKAAGTVAGTNISNTATVNYSVSAVAQPALTATADFVVDRKVDLMLTRIPGTYVNVTPGTTGNAIAFTLTNTSNAALGFNLAAANAGTDPFGGTDNFNPTVNNVFVDGNANAAYDVATDTATTIATLAPDASTTVFIVSSIPGGQAGGSIAVVTMTATARETTANGGGALTNDSGVADTAATVQTVFADGQGTTDALHDAAYSATGAFRVLGATVTVTKTETVLNDPINGVTNPKHIPGAVVEYTVTVANDTTATANADSITLTDVMPANVTFDVNGYGAATGIQVGGVAKTNASDADGADFTANTVNVQIGTLAPNSSTVVKFRATVN